MNRRTFRVALNTQRSYAGVLLSPLERRLSLPLPMHIGEFDQSVRVVHEFFARTSYVDLLRFQVPQHLVTCGWYRARYFDNAPAARQVFKYQRFDLLTICTHTGLPLGSRCPSALRTGREVCLCLADCRRPRY